MTLCISSIFAAIDPSLHETRHLNNWATKFQYREPLRTASACETDKERQLFFRCLQVQQQETRETTSPAAVKTQRSDTLNRKRKNFYPILSKKSHENFERCIQFSMLRYFVEPKKNLIPPQFY